MENLVLHERRQGERRENRVFFYYPERRTGFDRRINSQSSVLYSIEYFLSQQRYVFLAVIAFLNLANLADLLLTNFSLQLGFKEANLILSWLLARSAWVAAIFKLSLIGLVSYLMWRFRRYRYVIRLTLFALAMFLIVILYEIFLMILVLAV
jgi:hypothetical protein